MSSLPRGDEIIAIYEDQVEALEQMLHASVRAALAANSRSRFHVLSDAELQARLERDREELDRWALLMLVASFEATMRLDAEARIDARTKDGVRKPLRDLYEKHRPRVRLDDILDIWEGHSTVGATIKQNLRALLKHRHWLAHGRYWTNKHGAVPSPLDAHAHLDDYVQALQAGAADFPRG